MEKKVCRDCGKELPLDQFYKTKRSTGRYEINAQCKACVKVYRARLKTPRTGEEETARFDLAEKPKKKRKKKQSNYDLINEAQIEAAAHGMTYGQWEGQKYLKRLKAEQMGGNKK